MGELKSSIILDLQGNLERQADRFSGSLGRLSNQGSRHMQGLNRTLNTVGRGLDRLGNRYSALITGAAGVGTARFLIGLEERFTMLGIQADVSGDEINELKKQIYDVSRLPHIRIDPGELTAAVEDIVEKTGDLKFAQDNLENFAIAISATGGKTGSAIGQIAAEFEKMGLVSRKDVAEALDILTVQGKAGAFTLQNLAQLGSRVVTAYTAMGRTGVPAIREMGAALQVIRQGSGSSEQAATAFEALLRTLGNADKVKLLQRGGIKVFDEKAAKEGREVLRPLPMLMEEIIRKTGGKKTLLSKVFDEEALRSFNAAAAEFNRTGSFASLQNFMQVQADGTVLMRDSARAAHDAGRALRNLYTAWQQFADRNLSEPLQKTADALNSLDAGTVDRWLKIAGIGAGVLGTAIIGRKIYQGGRSVMSMFGKGGAAGKMAGAAGFGEAIPVYVVNGPASIWPGAGGAAGAAGAAGISKFSMASGAMAPATLAVVTAAASQAAGKYMASRQAKASTTEQLLEMQSRINVMGGGPNSYQARLIASELERRGEMSGNLKVEILTQPGTRAVIRDMRSHNLDLDVDSGQMMRSH